MRTIQTFLIAVCVLLCERAGAGNGDSAFRAAVFGKQFVFRAEWAVAFTGERKQLIPPYELTVSPDSISAYLPFFGRLYTAPTPEDLRFMSIHFTSSKFDYKASPARRGGYHIELAPTDAGDVRRLEFSVERSRAATLTIRSSGRDPMSYEGSMEPLSGH